MKNTEIERKFTIKNLPRDLAAYPHKEFTQGYLNTSPVVRIRREQDQYFLTYKGSGLMSRTEYNLPLDEESFAHLLPKCDGNIISKTRYFIPLDPYTIELDVFHAPFEGLMIAEVEFPSEEEALAFNPPEWFFEDVTEDPRYHNSNLSKASPNINIS